MRITIPLFCLIVASGCADYDPPPQPNLVLPETGTYELGAELTIAFTEPVAASSLAIKVWPAAPEDITIENEFAEGVTPLVPTCQADAPSCEGAVLTLTEDRTEATLTLTDPAFLKAKVPWKLEVEKGLKDDEGRKTGVSYIFDFQFEPEAVCGQGEVSFENGTYHLLAVIDKPLPVTLAMFMDIQVAADGQTRMAGGLARPPEGSKAPEETTDPSELEVTDRETTFAMFLNGCMSDDGQERFFVGESFDINMTFGPVKVKLGDIRINATVEKDDLGSDRLEGTIQINNIVLDTGTETVYDPANTSFFAQKVPEQQLPEGVPSVCGEDTCGKIPDDRCNKPEDWPNADFCSLLEAPAQD